MECPKCGYMMDDFTTECPRCAKMAAQAPNQAPPTPPPAAGIPQPGARPAYGGYAQQAPARTSGLAIASLVLGIAGLCMFGVPSLIGLILGIVAMVQINNDRQRLQGSGLAIGGIIASAVAIGLWGMIGYGTYKGVNFVMKSPEGKAGMAISIEQQINEGLLKFRTDTGVYPDTLEDLTVSPGAATQTKIPAGSNKGPYTVPIFGAIPGTHIPANPLADKNDANVAHHWVYDKTKGVVRSTIEPPADMRNQIRTHRSMPPINNTPSGSN